MNDYKITPEQYQEIIDKIHLATISLESSSCKLKSENISDKASKIQLNDDIDYQRIDENTVNLLIEYKLSVRKGRRVYLTIKAKYSIILLADCKLTDEFIDIYIETNLRIHSYPYFRNFAQDTTSRMGIPPLTLPFYKVGIFSD